MTYCAATTIWRGNERDAHVTELHDAALQAVVWEIVKDQAGKRSGEARQLLSDIPVGDTIAARVGDTIIGKASKAKGAQRFTITDEDQFVRWVADRYPTEVEVRTVVNAAFLEVLRKDALTKGALIDQDGGVCPYAEIVTGSPTLTVRKEKAALPLVAELFAAGQLSFERPEAIES